MQRRFLALLAMTAAATTAAGCSGGGGGARPMVPSPASTASTAAAEGSSHAMLTVRVPRKRGPHSMYVSPSSALLSVAVNAGAAVSYGLAPSAPGCATQSGDLVCTFSLVAPAGHDTFALSLSDASGNVLSRNVVAATIGAGVSTPVNVTLAGIPASVIVVPGANAFSDSTVAPYQIPGLFPIHVEVEALDADGNAIVGPGAPTLTSLVVSNTSIATVAPAAGTDPFAYVLSPTGAAGGNTATLTATVQGLALGDGTTQTPVSSATQYAFTPAIALGSGPIVTVYSIASQQAFAQFFGCGGECGGNSVTDLTADRSGRVYTTISQFTGFGGTSSLHEFATGATAPALVISSGPAVHTTGGISLDSHENLWVANGNTGSLFGGTHISPSISELAFGSSSVTFSIAKTFAQPGGIAVDKNGDVFESDPDETATIAEYPPGSQTSSHTLSDASLAEPERMVTDASGGLYVVDGSNNDIAYFAAGSTKVTSTLTDSSFGTGIGGIAIDPSGNLWVSMPNSGITERVSAATLPAAVTITEILPGSGYVGYIP